MKTWSFTPPSDLAASNQNWETAIAGQKSGAYDPFLGTTPVANLFTNVDLYWGTYHCDGPVVFFSVVLASTTGGVYVAWPTGATVTLPFKVAYRGNTGSAWDVLEAGKAFPATTFGGGDSDWFKHDNNKILSAINGHTSPPNSPNVCISGWYFRD